MEGKRGKRGAGEIRGREGGKGSSEVERGKWGGRREVNSEIQTLDILII